MRKVTIDTTDNADMLSDINKLDGGVTDGDWNRVHHVLFVTREIWREVGLKFCFGSR